MEMKFAEMGGMIVICLSMQDASSVKHLLEVTVLCSTTLCVTFMSNVLLWSRGAYQ